MSTEDHHFHNSTTTSSFDNDECCDSAPFHSSKHADKIMVKMEAYHAKRQLCDVVLIAQERRIRAHRLVLSAASDYFEAMFTNDVREATEEEVKMQDVDPDALEALVEYMYTGM